MKMYLERLINMKYIAHLRTIDKKEQSLEDHLKEVGNITATLSSKIGTEQAGNLIGLLHDIGKYSQEFQDYLKSATGLINPDADGYVDFNSMKGKIDHSTAGSQFIYESCKEFGTWGEIVGQILSICIASHHSGLIDCLKPDGENNFTKRMGKSDNNTHKIECIQKAPKDFLDFVKNEINLKFIENMFNQLKNIMVKNKPIVNDFNIGFWTRMLFSCLIDADRTNSADFEHPENEIHRSTKKVDWSIPVNRLENFITNFKGDEDIDKLRREVSNTCKKRANEKQGIFTLTVPTGGGKTYTSLRYALHHAKQHKLDRIIYIIPFTSIIEQNADALRKAIENEADKYPWILEQHSNLEPEKQTWHSKLVSENWDAPIIMTTMVQFLEVLFSGGTRSVRKMHQLANSVLIFDEVQTLPINCTHLFCNAINFLTNYCKTTAVLCTATQPLLNELNTPEKGQLYIPPENELVEDLPKLFSDLKRVEISNLVRSKEWTKEQISKLAFNEFSTLGSCLIIVNTKSWAQDLYQELKNSINEAEIFHLSTNLCPAHRKTILAEVRLRLDSSLPVMCISTQLIEAGVDVDFDCVIRFLAGLDSIAQAAGRCNRNGLNPTAKVYVVNPMNEQIDLLTDIKVGRDKAKRVFSESFEDYLAPNAIKQYFKYYFFERSKEMSYTISSRITGRNDNLLNLLSSNNNNIGKRTSQLLKQSFMTAGKAFKAIDSPTQAVIVPYGEKGLKIKNELCAVAKEFDVKKYKKLLKQAQQYSVNVFPNIWKQLLRNHAVHEIQPDEGIYFLDKQYYSKEFGLSVEPINPMEIYHIGED